MKIDIKRLMHDVIHKSGFQVHRIPKIKHDSYQYETVRPSATYSPWNIDATFKAVYTTIQKFTFVDLYRCFELWKLVEQSSKLPAGNIIEIGVWRGGSGGLIAKQAKRCGISDVVYLCDTFKGVVKAGEEDSTYKGGEHGDTSREMVEQLIINQMNLDNVQILEGIFPDETAHM